MFNFKKERLIPDPIGEGAHGEVFSYQKDPQDLKWVVKRPIGRKIEDLFACLPEIVLGFSCDHPCIVPVKGFSIQPTADKKYEIYIKLPRMSGGTLGDEIKRRKFKNEYYSESELVKHFYALVCAVDYLHSKKIFHGDIKINNILRDEKGNLKLSDIGSAKYVPDEDLYHPMSTAPGAAINYKAPEVIQHERNLRQFRLKSEDERKNQPLENILKKDHLYLADSWSLGLAMLEMCMLVPRLIDPYDPVQLIEENLQRIKKETGKRYRDVLLEIIFGLVKTDPAQRLQVSAAKAKLEENFGQILTEDFKISLGFEQKSKQDASDLSDYIKTFNERAEEIMKVFEDDKREKEARLKLFEENIDRLQKRLEILNAEVEKIKTQKTQELEEIRKKYKEAIQVKFFPFVKQENVFLLERLEKKLDQNLEVEKQILPSKPRDEKVYLQKLQRVSDELDKKWNPSWFQKLITLKDIFHVNSQPFLSITSKYYIYEDSLKEIISDMVDKCCKEKLWEEMDGLELILGSKYGFINGHISDGGLKEFASQLGPRLSNLKHLVVDMNEWGKISDDGLKEFAIQIVPQLINIQHLGLHMRRWVKITDKGFEVFISQLAPQLTNIKYLFLDMLYWEEISDKGLIVLASQLLPKLASVHHLKLNFGGWKRITDEGLKAFAHNLGSNLVNLNIFGLSLHHSGITALGLDALANQITQNLTVLQELLLDLREYTFVSNPFLQKLSPPL